MSTPSPPVVATLIETVVNGSARLDASISEAITALNGKILRVELSDTGWCFVLAPGPGGVRVRAETEANASTNADVSIRATLPALMRLAGDPDGVSDPRIRIEGDMHTARRLQAVFAEFDIDWEGMLAAVIGDIPAHQLARLLDGVAGHARRSVHKATLDLAEYLQYDVEAIATKARVAQFIDEVDALRSALDRLEARVRRLNPPQ